MTKWEIIHDCDLEDDTPTCWCAIINHPKLGRFVWITKSYDGSYDVEIKKGKFETLVKCKTLTSAKRWVTINLIPLTQR